jgi:hypothetical protein
MKDPSLFSLNLFSLSSLALVMAMTFHGPEAAFALDYHHMQPSPLFEAHEHDHGSHEDHEELGFVVPFSCRPAGASQLEEIRRGQEKYKPFMEACLHKTRQSRWCEQLTRPNPSSRSTFICTYGSDVPHQLIHPDERTWDHAIQAVRLIQGLEGMGISIAQIYNWWRPEPYNRNVGGAAGRHPFGTSVDVRFASLQDMEKAHQQLCRWRSQGHLRALGYYGTTGLHLGVGDHTPNTWGKACPR